MTCVGSIFQPASMCMISAGIDHFPRWCQEVISNTLTYSKNTHDADPDPEL